MKWEDVSERTPTPVGWSDTDWIKHIAVQFRRANSIQATAAARSSNHSTRSARYSVTL